MPKVRRRIKLPRIKVIEVKGLPDLENDPVVLKKMQKAEDIIRKYGLPKDLEKRLKK